MRAAAGAREEIGAIAEPVGLDEVEAAVGEPAPEAIRVAGHRAVVAAPLRRIGWIKPGDLRL